MNDLNLADSNSDVAKQQREVYKISEYLLFQVLEACRHSSATLSVVVKSITNNYKLTLYY